MSLTKFDVKVHSITTWMKHLKDSYQIKLLTFYTPDGTYMQPGPIIASDIACAFSLMELATWISLVLIYQSLTEVLLWLRGLAALGNERSLHLR